MKKELEKPFEIQTASDIDEFIQKKFGYSLPPSIQKQLDEAIQSNKIKSDWACEFVDNMVKDTQKVFKWDIQQKAGIVSSYTKSSDKLVEGDIIIRQAKNLQPAQPDIFEAYKMTDSVNQKYLGAENSLDALKSRVEQYAFASAVKDLFPRYIKALTPPPPKSHYHDSNKEPPKVKEDSSLKDRIKPKATERPGMEL